MHQESICHFCSANYHQESRFPLPKIYQTAENPTKPSRLQLFLGSISLKWKSCFEDSSPCIEHICCSSPRKKNPFGSLPLLGCGHQPYSPGSRAVWACWSYRNSHSPHRMHGERKQGRVLLYRQTSLSVTQGCCCSPHLLWAQVGQATLCPLASVAP